MKEIIINPNLNKTDYIKHCMAWERTESVYINTSKLESIDDIVHCVNLALSMQQESFSYAILEQLSEKTNAPMDILEKIISTGDIRCCESICMRTDLNHKIREICSNLELNHKKP